jgi:hypothetical protein
MENENLAIETLAWELFQKRTGLRFKKLTPDEKQELIAKIPEFQEYRDEALKLYNKRLERKTLSELKKKYPVIDVPADGRPRWGGGAFTLAFVYSKHKGNFVLRGYHDEVRKYLKKNYTHYFVNYSLWSYSGCRSIWDFWKESISIFEPTKKRNKYEVGLYSNHWNNEKPEYLKFKRLPKHWIPEFDNL